MNEKHARQAVEAYVNGWKNADVAKITKFLSKDCKVIESHGPTYKGVNQVKAWAEEWHKDGGKVIRWDIDSFFIAQDGTVFFEWTFACETTTGQEKIEGVSIAQFNNDKIVYLREYRMTEPAFDWTPHE